MHWKPSTSEEQEIQERYSGQYELNFFPKLMKIKWFFVLSTLYNIDHSSHLSSSDGEHIKYQARGT